MFERFSTEARRVVVDARAQASALGSTRIDALHLFLGAIDQSKEPLKRRLADAGFTAGTVVDAIRENAALNSRDADALESIGIDLDAIRSRMDANFGAGALDQPTSPGRHLQFDASAKAALKLSLREAVDHHDREIRVEHVVLGLLSAADPQFVRMVQGTSTLEQLRSTVSSACGS